MILLPYRAFAQPRAPLLLNWEHPLARDLLFSADPWAGLDDRWTVSGIPSVIASPSGLALSGTASNYVYCDDAQLESITTACTWFWEGSRTVLNSGFLFGNVQLSGAGFNAGLYINGSNIPAFYIRNAASTSVNAAGGTGPSVGELIRMVGTYDGAYCRLYLNGRFIAQAAQSGNVNNASGDVIAFNRWNTIGPSIATKSARVWGRVLSDYEIFAVSTQPEQMYKAAPTRRLYFNAGISGGPTYTLTAAVSNVTLTGQSTGITAQRKLAAAQGSFTLSGQSVALKADRKIVASQGSFTLTELDADLVYTPSSGPDYTLTAGQGSFTFSGQAAALQVARKLAAAYTTYALDGQAATLTYSGNLHGFTQDQLDFLVSYMTANLGFPSAADVAVAVWAKALP